MGNPKADQILDGIVHAANRLVTMPHRGRIVPELAGRDDTIYREIFDLTYRIIYTVRHEAVNILLVADGRRDLERILPGRFPVSPTQSPPPPGA